MSYRWLWKLMVIRIKVMKLSITTVVATTTCGVLDFISCDLIITR